MKQWKTTDKITWVETEDGQQYRIKQRNSNVLAEKRDMTNPYKYEPLFTNAHIFGDVEEAIKFISEGW